MPVEFFDAVLQIAAEFFEIDAGGAVACNQHIVGVGQGQFAETQRRRGAQAPAAAVSDNGFADFFGCRIANPRALCRFFRTENGLYDDAAGRNRNSRFCRTDKIFAFFSLKKPAFALNLGLGRKLGASSGSAGRQNLAAALGGHAGAEAVTACSD